MEPIEQPKLSAQQQAQLIANLKRAGLGGIIDTIQNNTSLLPSLCDNELLKFITEDKEMIELKSRVRKVFALNNPVMIRGETGTGKELIARALHSGRKGKFKALNLTALPSELIESELFGAVKGAYTGSFETRKGFFEEAQDGTLFLDEIGDMPVVAQAKLLRTLQEKTIRRIGDVNEMSINCRIVCATHCDLEQMVDNYKKFQINPEFFNNIPPRMFREDLYWRLNAIELKTKPLRYRKEDIRELIDSIFDVEHEIPEEIRDKLVEMELLGNVRELESRVLKYKLFKEI